MIFWSGDKELMKKLRIYRDSTLSHDNLFHMILGYFGVQTPLYDSSLDLFNKE